MNLYFDEWPMLEPSPNPQYIRNCYGGNPQLELGLIMENIRNLSATMECGIRNYIWPGYAEESLGQAG